MVVGSSKSGSLSSGWTGGGHTHSMIRWKGGCDRAPSAPTRWECGAPCRGRCCSTTSARRGGGCVGGGCGGGVATTTTTTTSRRGGRRSAGGVRSGPTASATGATVRGLARRGVRRGGCGRASRRRGCRATSARRAAGAALRSPSGAASRAPGAPSLGSPVVAPLSISERLKTVMQSTLILLLTRTPTLSPLQIYPLPVHSLSRYLAKRGM